MVKKESRGGRRLPVAFYYLTREDIFMVFKTKGVCSDRIIVELDGDTIKHVEIVGGCSGNTQGVARLVQGMKVDAGSGRHPVRISWRRRSRKQAEGTANEKSWNYRRDGD